MKFLAYFLYFISLLCLCFKYSDAAEKQLPYGTPLGKFNGIVNFSNSGGSRYYDFLGWEYECVEYVNRYYYEIYAYPSWKGTGNAYEYFKKIPEKFKEITAYPNKNSTAPKTGNIIVWDKAASNKYAGHVAIVKDVTDISVTVIHQNVAQNKGDANLPLPISYNDGKYQLTGGPGTIMGWLSTSVRINELMIIDNDNKVNAIAGTGWYLKLSDGTATASDGLGYLNGFLYAPTILKDTTDNRKTVSGAWLSTKFKKSVTVDIFAFIPSKFKSKQSKQTSYQIGIYDPNGGVENKTATVDQSSILKDGWLLLLKNIKIQKGGNIAVAINNKTGEVNRLVIIDAIKLVSHW